MDSTEKLSYALGFLDCWQLFKKGQQDPQTHLKAAYVFEKLMPIIAPSYSDSQVIELVTESKEVNIIKLIENIFQEKASREQMLKTLESKKIDWSKLS